MTKGTADIVVRLMLSLGAKIVYCFPGKRFQRLEEDIHAMVDYPDGPKHDDATSREWNDWIHHRDMLEFRLNKLGISMPTTEGEWLRLRTMSAQSDRRRARAQFPHNARTGTPKKLRDAS